ncbi:MAG: hypothetical protein KC591_07180 [Gemmatimonadetes bacterium]|nr:hypothetical protein [Gemmatimonadota bacterium]
MRSDRETRPTRRVGVPIRVAIYVAIVAALWFGRDDVRRLVLTPSEPDRPLVVSGRLAAPAIVAELLDEFAAKYPEVKLRDGRGDAIEALEDLLNRRTDVAFSLRAPTDEELAFFRETAEDSLGVWPVATGALVVWTRADTAIEAISLDSLATFLATGDGAPYSHVYAPAPASGVPDALASRRADLRLPASDPRVIWVADEEAVRASLAADPTAIGIGAAWGRADFDDPPGLRILPLRRPGGALVRPGPETLTSGDYPLYLHLVVSSALSRRRESSMFVTWVADDRIQRRLDRSGFVPARWTSRPVVLTPGVAAR